MKQTTCVLVLTLQACSGPQEAPRVQLPVTLDASGVSTVTTDFGYEVTLTEARVMVEDFEFSIAGEAHTASLWQEISQLLVPPAHAHPGHFQGGDITGELRGRFLLDWFAEDPPELGNATLIVGAYQSANFTFARATEEDGLDERDPLLGHTALLRGRAKKDDQEWEFSAAIDSPEGRKLVGPPFELEVTETSTERLGFRLLTQDPLEEDTLFDGLDFLALEQDAEGLIQIGPATSDAATQNAHNLLRRTFQTHDHYDVRPRSASE